MKAEWLANVNGQEYGPYTWDQLLRMAAEGRVPAELPVRRAGENRWRSASTVPGLLSAAAEGSSPAPPPNPPARLDSKRKGDSHLKRARPAADQAAANSSVSAPPPPPPPPPAAPRAAAAEPPAIERGFPAIVTDALAPTAKGFRRAAEDGRCSDADDAAPIRRGNSALVIGVLVAVAATVLLAGGAAVWMARGYVLGSRPHTNGGERSPLAASPVSETDDKDASEPEKGQRPSEPTDDDGPTAASLAVQSRTVKSISSWQSLAGIRSFGVSNANLQVTKVWRVDAAADEKSTATGAFSRGAQHVCVEVAIHNKSRSPLKYWGWNSYGENGAILADEGKNVLPLVPLAKTPDLPRLTGGNVPGGETASEILVFEAPASDDEVLYLVLPYSVFYSNVRPPFRAIELTPDIVGTDIGSATAARSAANDDHPAGRALGQSDAPRPPGSTSSPAADAASNGGAKGKKQMPSSLRDIINSDPGSPAIPADGPPQKDAKAKDSPKTGNQKPGAPHKKESPLDPKGNAGPEEKPQGDQ